MTYNHLKKLNNHLDSIIIILPGRFSWLIVVDNKILGGAGTVRTAQRSCSAAQLHILGCTVLMRPLCDVHAFTKLQKQNIERCRKVAMPNNEKAMVKQRCISLLKSCD